MSAAEYADYVGGLKVLLEQIDARPEDFRTLDVHIELAHKGMLFVYETRKKKGQTDSIYYARMMHTGTSKQISQKTAYDAVSAFMQHGQFLALTGTGDHVVPADSDHPSCVFALAYRKTGMEKAPSMKMIFMGFANSDDALAYSESAEGRATLVTDRPFLSDRVWEWK